MGEKTAGRRQLTACSRKTEGRGQKTAGSLQLTADSLKTEDKLLIWNFGLTQSSVELLAAGWQLPADKTG
jgi:hypothetical protein